jgi:hypothetical protein
MTITRYGCHAKVHLNEEDVQRCRLIVLPFSLTRPEAFEIQRKVLPNDRNRMFVPGRAAVPGPSLDEIRGTNYCGF